MRNTIKKIVVEEFSKLTNTIESDFKAIIDAKLITFSLAKWMKISQLVWFL